MLCGKCTVFLQGWGLSPVLLLLATYLCRVTIPLYWDTLSSYIIILPSLPLNSLWCDHLITHLCISSLVIPAFSFLFPHNCLLSLSSAFSNVSRDCIFTQLHLFTAKILLVYLMLFFFIPKEIWGTCPRSQIPHSYYSPVPTAFAAQLAEHASVFSDFRFYSRRCLLKRSSRIPGCAYPE